MLFGKPFKGSQSYEWQILCLVFQVLYPHSNMQPEREKWGFSVWYDAHWWKYRFLSPIRMKLRKWRKYAR